MLSKRMTANRREANPEIHASRRIVKVIRELSPAVLVKLEDLTCLEQCFLSGKSTFLLEGAIALVDCILQRILASQMN